jgi:hypothetical protein
LGQAQGQSPLINSISLTHNPHTMRHILRDSQVRLLRQLPLPSWEV